jgi:NTE family protein
LVAADILTSRELVLRNGLVWQAVLASIAIPGVYPAQRIGPYIAVDGGVLNPFPVNVAAEMGAGTVIGVNLGSGAPLPEQEVDVVAAVVRPPALLGVLLHSIEMMQRGIDAKPTDATVITIGPKLDPTGVGLRNMEEGRRYVEDGAKAAEAALSRISAALPWLK